jgi:hypothetical protein
VGSRGPTRPAKVNCGWVREGGIEGVAYVCCHIGNIR